MNIKAVAADVDGTLTDEEKRISCSAIDAVRALESEGIPVVLASGNALCVLRTLRGYIGCSGAIIGEDGAVVEYRGELRVLGEKEYAERALARLKEEIGDKIVESWSNPYRYVDVALRKTVDKDSVAKVLVNFPTVRLLDSGYAYHIVDKSVDKGRGLRVAAELMGIGAEEIVAVGDSETDVRLLETAGYGIALANAHESLKAVADRVTTMRGGEGFAEAAKIILSERGRRTAFISGPIQGMEENQSYRETLRRILTAHGYGVLDPWERERTVYSSTGPAWWKKVPVEGFIRRDLEDIEKCDLFVAYLPRLSAGACMELFHARDKGKRTVVICQIEDPSPWIIAHSDFLFRSLKEFALSLPFLSGLVKRDPVNSSSVHQK